MALSMALSSVQNRVIGARASQVAMVVARRGFSGNASSGELRAALRKEGKILAYLAVATFAGTVGWQYYTRTPSRAVRELAARGAEERLEGRPREARRHYTQAQQQLRVSHASDDWHLFTTTFVRADLSLEAGDLDEAEEQFLEAERLCDRMTREFSSRRLKKLQIATKHAVTMDRLAQVKQEKGDSGAALRCYTRGEELLRASVAATRRGGPTHDMSTPANNPVAWLELAGLLNNKARLLAELGRYDEAEAVAKEVVSICKGGSSIGMTSQFGEEHHSAAEGDKVHGKARKSRRGKAPDKDHAKPALNIRGVAADLLKDVRTARREAVRDARDAST